MNNYLYILLILLCVACHSREIPEAGPTYQEAADPDTTDYSLQWKQVKGLQASFTTLHERHSRSAVPDIPVPIRTWKGTGWKGERLQAQLLLWSDKEIRQAQIQFTPFRNSEKEELPASIGNASFVRYVLTDIFDQGCGYRKPEDFPVYLVPDALDTIQSMNIEEKSVRPIWLSFDIPPTASPGTYKGKVEILSANQKKLSLNINIEVQKQILPSPKEWKYHLDLWQHPSAVARVHNVECWSEEHWKLLEKPMKLLAEAGQKVITATLNKDPWNNQCYDRYEEMIRWIRKKDGNWTYDYRMFDRWVSFMMQQGIGKIINCYSMAPWNNELQYYNEATEELITISARPGTPEFRDLWIPFLKDFCRHLKEKGWLEITHIAMDERAPEIMKATLELLQKEAPGLGVSLADNHRSYQQFPWLKDICIEYGATFAPADLAYRKENGLISTFYTYCATEFPNVFTFSDPAEAVYISWYAMATGLDGFLRWAYNSWTENPLIDSRFRTWPAGDTYIIYPGGRSSIRFERLREGIQDAEKIRILKEQFTQTGEQEKLNQLETILQEFNFTGKPETPCSILIDQAKQQLKELSN